MTAATARRVAAVPLIAVATACSPSWGNDNSAPVDIVADNYIEHRIQLDEGTHRLDASTAIGGQNFELSEEFNDTSSDPPGFSFDIQDEPIGFA